MNFNASRVDFNGSNEVIIFFQHSFVVNLSAEAMRILALLASLLNMFILASIKSNFFVYKLLTVMAFVDSLYISTLFLYRMTELYCYKNPLEHCPNTYFLFYTAYIWISDYLTSCCVLFNIFLEIFITLQRLFMVSNNLPSLKNCTKVKLISLAIFIVSFSAYVPVLFMKRVELKPEQNPALGIKQYWLVKTEFGKSRTATVIMNTLSMIRVILLSVVLLVLNFVTVVKFRRFLKRRKMHLKSMTCK
jgi:hypothetical protein